MDRSRCFIRGLSIISAVSGSGDGLIDAWQRALKLEAAPCRIDPELQSLPVFRLDSEGSKQLAAVSADERYCRLDTTARLAVASVRETLRAVSKQGDLVREVGCISIGSSRGPTEQLENTIAGFNVSGKVAPLTSPVTTAGNISSWAAQEYIDLLKRQELGGGVSSTVSIRDPAVLSTSMTCSSAFHSLLVARSFVLSGMAKAALFGGSEACLTAYTLAQLDALRIYARGDDPWPCRPLWGALEQDSATPGNRVVLGEGAGTALLVSESSDYSTGSGDLELFGVGWGLEEIPTPTGISSDGSAFERAMRMAIGGAADRDVEIVSVIMHAPGSKRGDSAELQALRRVLGDVAVYSTKHITGHTYGASGMVSLGLAYAILSGVELPELPYLLNAKTSRGARVGCADISLGIRKKGVLINTAGFGGNAISVLVGC